jgi:F-type H+-transporting ATPase subunit gamma
MKSPREIRKKLKLTKNVQKITHAMQMVSVNKLRRAKESMLGSRPYAEKITQVIEHLANADVAYSHPFMELREVKQTGFIVISTDRGLCGALNLNLFREILAEINVLLDQNIEAEMCLVGEKASGFFRRCGNVIVAKATQIHQGERGIEDLIGVVKIMLDHYRSNRIQSLFLGYNRFVNTMSFQPKLIQLLPIVATPMKTFKYRWDYIYEPHVKSLLDPLLNRYVESIVYQAMVENIACEYAARMLAMKNASENAQKLIEEFQLFYNKARQMMITNELAEIVAGETAIR